MNQKRLSIIFGMLIMLLTACGAKREAQPQVVKQIVKQTAVLQMENPAAATAIMKPYEAPSGNQSQTAEETTASSDVAMLNYQASSVRMVIKDAEIELLVENTDRAIDQVTQMAADYGGYLLSSQSWYDGEFKYAAIRLAVPSGAFETALTNLRHIGVKVMSETGSGQDVSAEYTDMQSRLTNLEATAARVREFLNAAQTVEESLKVNQQLSELEAQIEQIKGQMKYYEGRTAFSTITANLIPQRPTPTPAPTTTPTATPTPRPGWNPTHTFNNASGVLSALFRATIDVLIWLMVVFGPFVLVLGILLWLLDRILHLRTHLQNNLRQTTSRPPAQTQPTDPTNGKINN